MAHIFEKADKLASVALELLQRQIVVPTLFANRYTVTDFRGARGDTVNVKRPAILKARDAGFRNRNHIVMDDLIQTTIPVVLDRYPYSGVALSDEELTLDVTNFAQDVTAPQARALAIDFENSAVGTLAGATFVNDVDFEPTAKTGPSKDPRKVAIQGRKLLNDFDVPFGNRFWIVGSDVSAAIASEDKMLDVNTAGLSEAAREGFVGRLGGFTIIESNALAGDESYMVHNSALALAYVAPAAPRGATSGGVAVDGGFAVRQLFDYDADSLADRSILSVFTGGGLVEDPVIENGEIAIDSGTDEVEMHFVRAVKVNFDGGSSV